MRTPILETDRLLLRQLDMVDAKRVFECWESDPDVAKYMFWTSHNDINKTKEWLTYEVGQIEAEDWYRWGIVEKEKSELIGTCLIYFDTEVSSYEIGYNLGKEYWNQGYATEAMKEVIRFAKEELKLNEIVSRYAIENTASENVIKKLGFQYEKDCFYECNNGAVMRQGKLYRLHLKEKITLCGDNCIYCPRYNAKSDEELQAAAELWYRVGWWDSVVSNDEIKCNGCSSHKQCTYHLIECIKEHQVSKCNQCREYPCDKIKDMIERSTEYMITCKEKCSKEEYDILSKAFFEKEINLNNQ